MTNESVDGELSENDPAVATTPDSDSETEDSCAACAGALVIAMVLAISLVVLNIAILL